MCRQLVMSLIITRIQPTEQTSPALESGKIKALSSWHKLVQHRINSLNSPFKERADIISLLTDEETEPMEAEMTFWHHSESTYRAGKRPTASGLFFGFTDKNILHQTENTIIYSTSSIDQLFTANKIL